MKNKEKFLEEYKTLCKKYNLVIVAKTQFALELDCLTEHLDTTKKIYEKYGRECEYTLDKYITWIYTGE